MQDMMLILDFNHRFAAAAALKLRAEGICCRILPGDTLPGDVLAMSPLGILLAGGVEGDIPMSLDGRLMHAGIPLLALGNAAASLCLLLNGKVGEKEEVNAVDTVRFQSTPITEEMTESERMLGTYYPLQLTEELSPIAAVEEQVIGFQHNTLPIYGLGFQIESNDPDGSSILMRFAKEVCGCTDWWNESAFISAARSDIAAKVQEGIAVCALTGGLDSGVSAAIAHRALGDRLRCIFIDTGLLRQDEAEDFLSYYRDIENLNITRINAQDQFIDALKGLHSERDKRCAIERTMRAVLAEAVAGMEYDAIIRGVTCNEIMRFGLGDSGLPSDGKVVLTPLGELFKEEVRYIGEKLGLPPEITSAQPFPGTGLALRIHGEATRERLDTLRLADAMFCEDILASGHNKKLWKYYAALQPMEQEGEDGVNVISLRAISLIDVQLGGTTAIPARLPYDMLERYVERLR